MIETRATHAHTSHTSSPAYLCLSRYVLAHEPHHRTQPPGDTAHTRPTSCARRRASSSRGYLHRRQKYEVDRASYFLCATMSFVIPWIISMDSQSLKPAASMRVMHSMGQRPRPSALTVTCCSAQSAPSAGPSSESFTMKSCTSSRPPGLSALKAFLYSAPMIDSGTEPEMYDMRTSSKAPSGVGQSGEVASSSVKLTRACTSADWLALIPSPVLHTSGSSRTVDLSPGVLSTKTYEKAPEPPPTSSMLLTSPRASFFFTRYFAVATDPLCCACVYVAAVSGSENHEAYDGASPVVMTSGSAPMR